VLHQNVFKCASKYLLIYNKFFYHIHIIKIAISCMGMVVWSLLLLCAFLRAGGGCRMQAAVDTAMKGGGG